MTHASRLAMEASIATCKVDGCDGPLKSLGYCKKHYQRVWRYGDPNFVQKVRLGPGECSIEGCDGPRKARGWCVLHYDRWRRHGDPTYERQIRGDRVRRFHASYERLDRDDCWPWTAAIDAGGYGSFWDGTRTVRAHRFSYEHFVEPIPEGLHIRHTCDNRQCVNFHHMLTGTNADNVRDKVERGRIWWTGTSQLDPGEVRDIRQRRASGETTKAIALSLGCSPSRIARIVSGKSGGPL